LGTCRKNVTETAIAVLSNLGVRVVEVELPEAAEAWRILSTVIVMADAAALHPERMEKEPQWMDRDVYDRIAVGRNASGMQYAEALRFREHWRQRVASLFHDGIDMLAMPTTRRTWGRPPIASTVTISPGRWPGYSPCRSQAALMLAACRPASNLSVPVGTTHNCWSPARQFKTPPTGI
jgi:Asp-tRNA(Asn)/Glu-tRNA(Gln) amidotransferase A subunit family amidase